MALRGRNIENFDGISLAAWTRRLPICVSWTSFQKSSISWPQQPPTERVSDISGKLDFWWSISQKGAIIGQFGAKNDLTIRISNFLMKWGCQSHWGHWGCWGCRGSKAWKITTGDFKIIQVLEFSFILMFWTILNFFLEKFFFFFFS